MNTKGKEERTVDVVFNVLGAGYEYEGERGRSCLTTTLLAKNINLLIKCFENCTIVLHFLAGTINIYLFCERDTKH